jgi:hypothetical protein
MATTFDINDRATWTWVGWAGGSPPAQWFDNGYTLDPADKRYFYQLVDGAAYRMPCGAMTQFNPAAEPGPVCDHPENVSEAVVYDWCVKKGIVTDQR